MKECEVEEILRRITEAVESIDDLNRLPPDENGHCWSRSDLIAQEVVGLRQSMRVLREQVFHSVEDGSDDDSVAGAQPQSQGEMTGKKLLEAALAEFSLEPPFDRPEEIRARQAAIRGMMVRLGLYEDFTREIQDIAEKTGHLPQPHPDDLSVDSFAQVMKRKLAKKRGDGRSGWKDPKICSQEDLSSMLREHVEKGDPVDVANFAMMLHQRGERILWKTHSPSEDAISAFGKALLEGLPDGPWAYRPAQTDDWGEVRGPDGSLIAKAATRASLEEMNAHRHAGTDPAERIGRFIASARSLIPDLLREVSHLSSSAHGIASKIAAHEWVKMYMDLSGCDRSHAEMALCVHLNRTDQPDRDMLIDQPAPSDIPTHRHRKGGLYRVIGRGYIESDMRDVIFYRDTIKGIIWARPVEEFMDGRFTALSKGWSLPEAISLVKR